MDSPAELSLGSDHGHSPSSLERCLALQNLQL